MSRQIDFTNFEYFLNFLFPRIERIENEEFVFLNVFANTQKYDQQYLNKVLTDGEFNKENITLNFPDIIVTENMDRIYYVGKDAYDKNIEYFTVRIKK